MVFKILSFTPFGPGVQSKFQTSFLLFYSCVQSVFFFYEIPHSFVIITIGSNRHETELEFLHEQYLR